MNKQEIVDRLDLLYHDENLTVSQLYDKIYSLICDIEASIEEETTYVVTIPQEFGYTKSDIS